MKKLTIPKGVHNFLTKVATTTKAKSPTILIFAGIAGVIGGTVMAVNATKKAAPVLEEAQKEIQEIRERDADEDKGQNLTKAYIRAGAKVGVIYLPSAGLMILSIVSILASHRILTRRNAALTAAYSALSTAFKEYRGRVAAKYGEEAELAIRYDIQEVEYQQTVVGKDGKEKKIKKKAKVANLNEVSEYARYFMPFDPDDLKEGSEAFDKDKTYAETFIRLTQFRLNDLLRAKGYLFLNDAYESLGFKRTVAGQIVGWIYDPSNNASGDSYIQIKMIPIHKQAYDGSFVDGFILDFNVDGPVLNSLKNKVLADI